MIRYDEEVVYLTATNEFQNSDGDVVSVEIHITNKDHTKWEDLDDTITFAGELAAELPGIWSVYIGYSSSFVLQRADGLRLRIYNGKMVGATVDIPVAFDGGDPWSNPRYLEDDDPQEVPIARANRSRGIKAIAADFNRRVLKTADAVWATAQRHVKFKSDERALKLDTAQQLADAFGTKYRESDGPTGYAKGEVGLFPTRVFLQVTAW